MVQGARAPPQPFPFSIHLFSFFTLVEHPTSGASVFCHDRIRLEVGF